MKKNIDKLTEPGKGKLASVLDFISFLCTPPGWQYATKLLRKRFRPGKIDYHRWINEHLQKRLKANAAVKVPAGQIQVIHAADLYNTVRISATPDYYLFIGAETIVTEDCIQVLTQYIATHPATDLVYADQDQLIDGKYSAPYFKPAWSPDTLLTRNYIGCSFLISRRILLQCGGIKEMPAAAAMYDLLLRATEHTLQVHHITEILFHHVSKAEVENETVSIVREAIARRNTPATVSPVTELPGCLHVNYKVLSHDKVSIVIPTKDQAGLLRKALESILEKTTYSDYEIIVLDNNSTTHELHQLKEEYLRVYPGKVRFIDAPFAFNFSRLMNLGVSESEGKFILMLNNDVEVIHGDWMERMVGYAQLPHVGAVGAKLLYPDNKVQHAGIALGINDGDAGHVFVNAAANDTGYHGSLAAATNYSAATAACLMCRKEAYQQVGGMDEQLAIEYNDVDLCLAFRKSGYHNVVLPEVTLYHYESATRAHPFRSRASWQQHEKEFFIFKAKWSGLTDNDPFYNKNQNRDLIDFRIRTASV